MMPCRRPFYRAARLPTLLSAWCVLVSLWMLPLATALGAASTANLVLDINPGQAGSSFFPASVNVNGTLFFQADDGVHGKELWKSDGTPAGTMLVKDINSGPGSSNPWRFTKFNGMVFFRADDGVNGKELWRSDGTPAGTQLVKNISPGSTSSDPSDLTVVNSVLFFKASGDLWKTNGTLAGTVLVNDRTTPGAIAPRMVSGSFTSSLTDVNGTLFFTASGRDPSTGFQAGEELWKSDGTPLGTVLVKDISAGGTDAFDNSWTDALTNVGGTLYFVADDGVHGPELWKSDGTEAGTVLVKDINPGVIFSSPSPMYLTSFNGKLFFTASDKPPFGSAIAGREMWISDGTGPGTTLFKDINPGSGDASPDELKVVNGVLFFTAFDGVDTKLWKSNGQAVDTVGLKALVGMKYFTGVNGALFFAAWDPFGGLGQELWKSDGTTDGTVLVHDINPGSPDSNPNGLVDVNGTLLFMADDGVVGREWWSATSPSPDPENGSSAGCSLCSDAGEPVNTFSGELYETLPPDIDLGGPMALKFQRYYAAFLRRNFIVGDLGSNWRHNFDARLFISGNTARYVSNNGRVTTFLKPASVWVQQDNLDSSYQLSTPANQDALLLDPSDNLIYTFNFTVGTRTIGKLVKVEDGKGNVHTVSYDPSSGQIQSVSDGLGRSLIFSYNSDAIAKVSIVTDGVRSVQFQYTDPLDTEYLTQVIDVRGGLTTYSYENTSTTADHALMKQWMMARGNVPFTQVFDALGRVTTQTDADGNALGFAYGVPGVNQTTLTDPLGVDRVHSAEASGAFSGMQDPAGQSFSLATDANGRRNSLTDRLGDTTTLAYHAASGKLSSVNFPDASSESYTYAARSVNGLSLHDMSGVTYADGSTESLTYDAVGNLISRTDQLGNARTFTYNGLGQVLTATNRLAGVTTNIYNADGTLLSSTDPAANTTTWGYDGLLRPTLVTHADGSTRSMQFDAADNLLSVSDENANVTHFSYDANSNLASIQDPLANTTSFSYDGNDRLLSITDALGGVFSRTWHPLGGVGSETDANNNTVTFAYDSLGRLIATTDALSNTWLRSYDAEKVLASVTDPLSNTVTFASDTAGRITDITSPLGHISSIAYDVMGRISATSDALGNTTIYHRDLAGRLTGVDLPGSVISTSMARNARGQLTGVTDANGNVWARSYDTSGRLVASTDPLGRSKSTAYDSRNRPATITFPGSLGTQLLSYSATGDLLESVFKNNLAVTTLTLGFSYDANRRITAANSNAAPSDMTRSYDATGRISNSNGIVIGRDAGGRITSMTLAPGKVVSYAYDAADRLTSVSDWAGGLMTFSYDAAGRLTGITRPNGINTGQGWDNDSRLIGVTESGHSSISLSRDANGQIRAANRNVPQVASVSTLGDHAMNVDAAAQIVGNSYDALGRRTGSGADSFSWDAASRLVSYTVNGVTVNNSYDALGRRTRRSAAGSSGYVWNDALGLPSISVEKRSGVDFRYFVHTPGGVLLYSIAASGNARQYYHYDETGNTIFVSNNAGAVIGSYAYTPFGRLVAASGGLDNPFTWQGRAGVMDEGNGYYYIRARYYDANTARFISRDANKSIDPLQVNPYQYARNNPLRFVDVDGLDPETIVDYGQRVRDAEKAETRARERLREQRETIHIGFDDDDLDSEFAITELFLGGVDLFGVIAEGKNRDNERRRRIRTERVARFIREVRELHLKVILEKARQELNSGGTRTRSTQKALQEKVRKAKKAFEDAGGVDDIDDIDSINPDSVIPELAPIVTVA